MSKLPQGFEVVGGGKPTTDGRGGLPPGFKIKEAAPLRAETPAQPQQQQTLTLAPDLRSLPLLGPIAGAMGMDGRAMVGDQQPAARERYEAALERVRQLEFTDMPEEEWQRFALGEGRETLPLVGKLPGSFAPYDATELSQHGMMLGLTDELESGKAALGAGIGQLFGGKADMGEVWQARLDLEQARRDLGREQQGLMGTLAEGFGGLASGGAAVRGAQAVGQTGNALAQTFKSMAGAGAQGAAYGFGATDGGLAERGTGAAVGAGISTAAGVAIPAGFRAVQNINQRGAARAAVKRGIAAAPKAQDIRAQSKAAYRASEATGAVVDRPALKILNHDTVAFARAEGLILPSGRIADGFPKFAGALRTVKEFSDGPLDMKQAQTVQRALRRVAKSTDPEEARLGGMMLDSFEDFMDSLPPSAFAQGNGAEAVRQWTKARADWARFRRTQTIEGIIEGARIHDAGFAAGIRAGFKRVLKSPKKQRGFSKDDIAAMRAYVDGGSLETLLKRVGSGAGLPGVGVGGLAGGLSGAVAVPVVGALARGAVNRGARRASEQLRASVATPGGIPRPRVTTPQNRTMAEEFGRRVGNRASNPMLDDQRAAVVEVLMGRAR